MNLFRVKLHLAPLVNIMLDQLPADVFMSSTTTFLDPAMAGGQFLREVITRLRAAGHSDDNIRSRIWGCEILNGRLNYSRRFGGIISDHLIQTDFLSHDWGNMKFDVVLGNPPYQSTESAGKKLWPGFVEKGFELLNPHGHLIMITPATWLSRPQGRSWHHITHNIFKENHMRWISWDVNQHFHIGETVTAWYLQKTPAQGATTQVVSHGEESHVVYDSQVITKNITEKMIHDVLQKVDAHDGARLKQITYNDVQGRSIDHYLHTGELTTRKHKNHVPVFWTASNKHKYFTSQKHQRKGVKVIVNLSGYYYSESDPDKYMCADQHNTYAIGAGALGIPCDTLNQAHNCKSFLTSKLYQFYVNHEKTSGFNTGIIKLPLLDMNITWHDAAIYQLFDLTREQIEFVEQQYTTKSS